MEVGMGIGIGIGMEVGGDLDMQDILVIGYSTRNIVCSARRAGYNVYSIDAFADSDLVKCAAGSKMFDPNEATDVTAISRERMAELINSFGVDFDAIVLGSGFEMMDLTDLTDLPYPILNNPSHVMQEVSDKEKFALKLASIGVVHPYTYHKTNIAMIKYPVMVKPKCAGGGKFNRVVENVGELNSYLDEISNMNVDMGLTINDMLIQEFVSGVPVSVSVISTKQRAVAVAVNEQMIGVPWLTRLSFAYCGNITPFETPYEEMICEMAEDLIMELGLVGSNGVDFMLTYDGPVVIEVNARFQGSMDSVELSTGINLFDAHVKAFAGELIPELQVRPAAKHFAARAVIYAEDRVLIDEKAINGLLKEPVVDIPNVGYVAYLNEPVISVLCVGNTRDDVMANVKESVCNIRDIIGSKNN
ncbi:MAG: ATP-grasp domain-containing protein [Methanosarcinaceae archaeon]|nr:ATP-grasp domain-containing protein [Methanosarcinaceae archaeon]